jgi:hypothetical protein
MALCEQRPGAFWEWQRSYRAKARPGRHAVPQQQVRA